MQPTRFLLLFLFLLLLPGTWADPEGSLQAAGVLNPRHNGPALGSNPLSSYELHIFQTFIFYNTSFVDISSWATLEDIIFATLQEATQNILYLYPWVYPSLPAAEWKNLLNLFRVYMHHFVLSMSRDATLYQIPYKPRVLSRSSEDFQPFRQLCCPPLDTFQYLPILLNWWGPELHTVLKCFTGCDLYPNGSYTKFYHLAYNGHDFLSFDVDRSHWERQQDSELAVQVVKQYSNFLGFSETLQDLLNVTCVDHMKKFIKYGRATLERQGSESMGRTTPRMPRGHTGPPTSR
ncbi:PREDICTED: antigen-presenting glycoprotein CD1d-like [Chlamydotis macqueenii]|uniref:antigen-presenting glycoprotein CD1d-like n=1 Tax=Chlamydotis macqueenii TaxID=187382 RepID=UPI00052978B5|nr:PREDICTED: antigen-presenting glycoprotein CD1d-like [Chlamydotis macqueenii]